MSDLQVPDDLCTALLDAMPAGVAIFGAEGSLRLANAHAKLILQEGLTDFLGAEVVKSANESPGLPWIVRCPPLNRRWQWRFDRWGTMLWRSYRAAMPSRNYWTGVCSAAVLASVAPSAE